MKKRLFFIVALFMVTFGIYSNASAATVNVADTLSLQYAIDSSNSGDIIIISKGTYSAVTVPKEKDVTIKGSDGAKFVLSGKSTINLKGSLKLDNVLIEGNMDKGYAPITLTNDDSKIYLQNKTIIKASGSGSGDGAVTTIQAIQVACSPGTAANGSPNNTVISMASGSEIMLNGNYARGICYVAKNSGSRLTIDDSKILCMPGNTNFDENYYDNNPNYPNGTYSRGIGTYGNDDCIIDIKNSSEIKGFYYSVNISDASGVSTPITVNIDNSKIEGYAAINAFVSNATINMKNGSILTGRNLYNSQGANNFATIVFNNSNGGNTLNVDNSTLINYSPTPTGNEQYSKEHLISVIGENYNVNLSNNTKLVDTTGNIENAVKYQGSSGINYTIDSTVKLVPSDEDNTLGLDVNKNLSFDEVDNIIDDFNNLDESLYNHNLWVKVEDIINSDELENYRKLNLYIYQDSVDKIAQNLSSAYNNLELCTHTFDKTSTVDSTCVEEGEIEYTCTKCGYVKTESIPLKAHTWGSGVETKKATCIAKGVKTYTCSVCKETKTEEIPIDADAHEYDNPVIVYPTCTQEGSKTYTCKLCQNENTVTLDPWGHEYSDFEIINEPTCTNTGLKQKECRICGEVISETIPIDKTNHLGGTTTSVTTYPTCANSGQRTITCNACGEIIKTEAIAPRGHSFGESYETSDATCTSPIMHIYTCAICDSKDYVPVGSSLGHNFGSYYISVAPTYTREGKKQRECSRCDKVESVSIPKLQYVTRMSLSKTSLTISGNYSYALKVTVSPSNAYNKDVTYISKNTKVASVTSSGVVRGVGVGKTTIVVSADDRDDVVLKNCTVTVVPSKVTSLKGYSGKRYGKVTYNKSTLAKSYEIYRSTRSTSGFTKIATTSSLSYKNKGLKKGKVYYYKVRAINGSYKGSYSSVVKVKIK